MTDFWDLSAKVSLCVMTDATQIFHYLLQQASSTPARSLWKEWLMEAEPVPLKWSKAQREGPLRHVFHDTQKKKKGRRKREGEGGGRGRIER